MALTGGEVQLKTEGAVATLTLSNGPYTVITWEMRQLMAERFAEIDADRQIRVVVVRSAGKHFSSGGDIAGFMEVDPVDFTDLGHNVTAAARSPKPVIAVIDGYWFGVGLVIALSCDIRLATARSEFALPEVKLGMIPGSGGTQRLARLIGLSTAAPTARFTPASSWSERRMPCSAPVPTSPRAWPPLPRSASPASRSGSADEGGTVRLRAPGHH